MPTDHQIDELADEVVVEFEDSHKRITLRGLAVRQELFEARMASLIRENGMNGERPLVVRTTEKVERMEPIVMRLEPLAVAAEDLAEMAADHKRSKSLAEAQAMVEAEAAKRREQSLLHRYHLKIRAVVGWFIAALVTALLLNLPWLISSINASVNQKR